MMWANLIHSVEWLLHIWHPGVDILMGKVLLSKLCETACGIYAIEASVSNIG